MPGFGDRLFVSTSLALLLLTVTATLADPTGAGIDATKRVQETGRSLAETGSERAMTQPLDLGDEAEAPSPETMAPTSTTNPNQTFAEPEAPVANSNQGTVKPPPASVVQPTPTPNPQPTAAPEIPAATVVQPANSEPAAAPGEDAIPTTTVIVPPAAPIEPETIPSSTTVIDVDAPIAEQLRNLASGKFDRIIGKKDRASIEAFYAGRNYAPLWITGENANARAAAAIAYLGQVDADGLDPADYPVPNFASLSDPIALAEAEIRLTTSVVAYAHHAQIGRIHWSRVSGDIFYDTKAPDPAAVLANIARSPGCERGARRLRAARCGVSCAQGQTRANSCRQVGHGKPRIPNGPSLNIGMQDQRMPLLRLRLGVTGEAGAIYDRALAKGVKRFQQAHGTQRDRHAQCGDSRSSQRPPVRCAHRHHPCQHGTLALDAAQSRQHLRDRQSARLHAARHAAGQAGMDGEDRRRQADNTDAAHKRAYEVPHGQSYLECAGLDRR